MQRRSRRALAIALGLLAGVAAICGAVSLGQWQALGPKAAQSWTIAGGCLNLWTISASPSASITVEPIRAPVASLGLQFANTSYNVQATCDGPFPLVVPTRDTVKAGTMYTPAGVTSILLTQTRIPLLPAAAILSIPVLFLWKASRSHPQDHCSACGYDLRGNSANICPECGAQNENTPREERGALVN